MADTYTTARTMIAELTAKRISARELLDEHLARNAETNPRINAVIETDLARARADAAAIDSARARGRALGALAGLPMTIKDGFDVEHMPAVSGNPAYRSRAKTCADASVVAKVRAAGAVLWGKTNVPFMLGDIQSYNDIYGTTNNPYDVSRTPGGSSGGAAAALAAGVTPLEIGSDIGGSLRQPANFCGVTALKPSWGSLSMRGHVPPEPAQFHQTDLAVAGPMARNVDDLKLLWSVLRGTPEQPRNGVAAARIAVWDEEASWPLASEVRAGVARAADTLAQAGAQVSYAKPEIDGAALMDHYGTILTAILAAGLPDQLIATFASQREADRRIVAEHGPGAIDAAFRLRATASFRDIVQARIKQQAHKDALARFFTSYDAIVMPISMVTAFPHQQKAPFNHRILEVDGAPVPYPAILNWISVATALHAPALAVQAGQTETGLPVGVQIIGPWGSEHRLFDFAAAVEDGTGGFVPPAI
jgi:amidase